MRVFYNFDALKKALDSKSKEGSALGFVPTMGALHQGHLSLIKQASSENDIVIVSLFVNPTQFNNSDDFDNYPRTIEQDLSLLSGFENKVLVYVPEVKDIYQNGIQSGHFEYGGIENEMEGKFRPGHFDGVGTIVKRLFEIIKPTQAYFGEKDFQQLQIVKKLVEKYQIPVKIVGCPIYREANGLAMSSRNERLTLQERQEAALIFNTLKLVKEKFGTKSAKEVTEWVQKTFQNNAKFTLEYFEIANENTLTTCIRKSKKKKYRAFIAVFVNNIRLIDTISLN